MAETHYCIGGCGRKVSGYLEKCAKCIQRQKDEELSQKRGAQQFDTDPYSSTFFFD